MTSACSWQVWAGRVQKVAEGEHARTLLRYQVTELTFDVDHSVSC